MKRSILLPLLLLLTSTTLFAQSNTLSLFATSQRNGGGGSFTGDPGEVISVDFDNGSGFGASYARDLRGRLSFEGALFRTSSEVSVSDGFNSLSLGDLDLTTVTAMVRAHLRKDGPLDAYAGAGGAYVMASDVDDVPVDNEVTFAIGAGVAWNFSPRAGLVLDARYLPLTLGGTADGEDIEADVDPLLVSLGFRFRF
jgi:opacity protein-like surface antigen